MVHFDAKTKRQVAIFLYFISGLYMIGVIGGFLNTFNNLFAGISLVMILGVLDLYFGYLMYNGEL